MNDNLHDNELERLIVRYLNNQMSKDERYQFERALERDPFLAEAIEGLSEFKPSDVIKDLGSLSLHKRSKKGKIKPLFIVLVLLIILVLVPGIIWWSKHERKTDVIVEDAVLPDEGVLQTDTLVFSGNTDSLTNFNDALWVDSLAQMGQEQQGLNQTDPIVDEVKSAEKAEAVSIRQTKPVKANTREEEQEALSERNDSSEMLSFSLIPVPSIEANKIIAADSSVFSSLQLSFGRTASESDLVDKQPAELNKVEASTEETLSDSNAAPQGGIDELIQYVEKNVIYPLNDESGEREALRIGFTVSVSGRLYNFKQEQGPENQQFFNEAVRVLQQGPSWSPAIKDGKAVEEQVSLDVVFRP
ncbi:energy transducer TonB [Roseimarinus sediminis]|uniref:energy transducer TonB n=1 Tax=Roseimarinus sediminis TaxID=1610899 RepID=UPI003D1A8A82